MYIIRKEFSFSASHQLSQLPEEHPCTRIHGHNYIVVVELKSVNLDSYGFVEDYRSLDWIKKYIDETLDHRHLNDVFAPLWPTAEIMARELFNRFKEKFPGLTPQLAAVEVHETPKTSARYEPDYDTVIKVK